MDRTLESIVAVYYPPRKMVGRVYLPDLSLIQEGPLREFTYPVTFALAAFQTLQQTITLGHRFYLLSLTGNSNQAANFRVYIRDGKTRQPMMLTDVDAANFQGTAQHPFFLRRPHVFPLRRPVFIQVTDMSGAANNVQVCLNGAVYDG